MKYILAYALLFLVSAIVVVAVTLVSIYFPMKKGEDR